MLSASPVGDYKVTYDGPAAVPDRPWEAIAIQDAVDGYSRSYTSTTHAGGFGISAYQFPNHVAALSSVAAGYRAFVCRFGADPLAVAGHPGILAGTRPSEIVAMWVEGPRLVLVDYSRFGQPQQDVAQALVAIQATWSLSESAPPPTANSS